MNRRTSPNELTIGSPQPSDEGAGRITPTAQCQNKKFLFPAFLIVGGCVAGGCVWISVRASAPNDEAVDVALSSRGRPADCGAAALYLVCKLSGRSPSLEDLRVLTKTSELGTSMFDLKASATALGFAAEPCRTTFRVVREELEQSGCYAILHFQSGHFAAATVGSEKGSIRVLDNNFGTRECDEHGLRRIYGWEGATLFLRDSP